MLDTLQEIYGAIRRNRMRTIATGFAVASGLFLIIVLQGAGNGIIHSFEHNMGGFAFDAVHIFGGRTTKPYEGVREGRLIQLDNRDAEMTERAFSHCVTNVIPSLDVSGFTVSNGMQYLTGVIMEGVTPLYAQANALELLCGRFINAIDMQQKRKILVMSEQNVVELFPKLAINETLGKYVDVGGIIFQIVGICKTDQMSSDNTLYAPFSTLRTIYNRGNLIDKLSMTIRDIPNDSAMEQFMDEYVRASSKIHSFAPDDRQALWIWNQADGVMQMNKAKRILNTAFWILGLLTLVSGVVGVSNIMLISVKERTREFGIRRAIGARPWNIIRMVVLESVVITGVFGYIGMLFGIFFCEYMDATVGNQTMDLGMMQTQYFIDPTVGLSTCAIATLIIVVAGAMAGFFPALKAIKIKPIEALKG